MYESEVRREIRKYEGKILKISKDPSGIIDTLRNYVYHIRDEDSVSQYQTLMYGGYRCMYNGYPCAEIHFTEDNNLKILYRQIGFSQQILEDVLNLKTSQTSISIYTNPIFIHNVIQINHCSTVRLLTGNDLNFLLENTKYGEFPVVLNLYGDYQLITRSEENWIGNTYRSYCYHYMNWRDRSIEPFHISLKFNRSSRRWVIMDQTYNYHLVVENSPFILVSSDTNLAYITNTKTYRKVNSEVTKNDSTLKKQESAREDRGPKNSLNLEQVKGSEFEKDKSKDRTIRNNPNTQKQELTDEDKMSETSLDLEQINESEFEKDKSEDRTIDNDPNTQKQELTDEDKMSETSLDLEQINESEFEKDKSEDRTIRNDPNTQKQELTDEDKMSETSLDLERGKESEFKKDKPKDETTDIKKLLMHNDNAQKNSKLILNLDPTPKGTKLILKSDSISEHHKLIFSLDFDPNRHLIL